LNQREIDFVKLDIEGYEFNALKNFGEALQKIKMIQFEFGGACIDCKVFFQDFWYFFTRYNFILYRVTPLGYKRITMYREIDECFLMSNYFAINNN
jgi:hypothetical protein